jgi:hypothetical protein
MDRPVSELQLTAFPKRGLKVNAKVTARERPNKDSSSVYARKSVNTLAACIIRLALKKSLVMVSVLINVIGRKQIRIDEPAANFRHAESQRDI